MIKLNGFSLTIFHRVLLMSLVLAAILLVSMLIQTQGVAQMVSLIEGQTELTLQQDAAIRKQSRLLNKQDHLLSLQKTAQEAFNLYFQYQFWRYNSVVTEDDIAVSNADEVEQALRKKLSEIYALDEELGEAADVVAIYLDDFNSKINTALEYARTGESRNRIISKVGQAQSDGMAMNAMFDTILSEAANAVSGAVESVKNEGVQVVQAAAKVQQASADAAARGAQIESNAMVIVGIAVFSSLLIGILFSRSITQPIKRLHQVILEIEQKSDLSRRVNYNKSNEIGAIAQAFNSMLDKFQGIIRTVADNSSQLADSSRKSAEISELNSRSARKLQEETDMVATAVNEMSATVKGINENTDEAVKNAEAAQSSCRQGREHVTLTMNAIEKLSQEIDQSAHSVKTLAADSDAIGSVLDVIRGIAEQTNLLALNAAIEAARAGDQGRGFAVVADEVRTLAQKTGDSTNEIQTMIERLHKAADHAVQQMQQSQGQTSHTLETASRATRSIEDVLASVEVMNASNQQISSSTAEQAQVADSIDQSIVSISEHSTSVNQAANDTREASEQLNDMVLRLRSLVGQFRYESDATDRSAS